MVNLTARSVFMIGRHLVPACVIALALTSSTAVLSGQASQQREWMLQPGEDSLGVILAAARCGDIVYLGDTQQKIHRFNLETRKFQTTIGGERVAFPTTLTTDCSRRLLYLVTGIPLGKGATAAVQAFNLDTGELIREYPLPPFLPRMGTVLEDENSLLISGLKLIDRPAEEMLKQPVDRYYEGVRLGMRLSLVSGEAEPALVPYELRCIGGGQCPDVRTGAIRTKQGAIRVSSLPTSNHVGVYEQRGTAPRTIPIVSPRFTRTGEVLPVFVGTDVRMRWLSENSTIDGVYAFDVGVAVIHYRPILPAGYHVGERTGFSVFLNTYRWDGTALRVDVSLPDIPVGHDETSLYVIDYGAELRREGATTLKLVQVPIPAK